jgi:DUF1680 family protein
MKGLNISRVPELKDITLTKGFWGNYQKLIHDTVIPYQYQALNNQIEGAEPSYSVENFRIAALVNRGEKYAGEFRGVVFQDSDLAKWLEAVAYSLIWFPDAKLEKQADEMIDLIEAAQMEDGYLNTYFTITAPENRLMNLRDCHELYCIGHMIEAAVAYYKATGKRKFLEIMMKSVDYINEKIGSESGKIPGYPGHPEIELALIKMYRLLKEQKYLDLAVYFIHERGKNPNYFEWEARKRGETGDEWSGKFFKEPLKCFQAHKPVIEQESIEGHAVRALYLLAGAVDVAVESGDTKLLEACRKLWNNCVSKRMYVTGGVGTTHHGEAFTFDFDLPNDTAYAETCASIALVFVAQRLLQVDVKAEYADVMERALYNTVLSGISLDGTGFFYVNPLEVWPAACEDDYDHWHVKPVRQKWFGCACCPPNIARLISSLGEYVYSVNDDTVYTHLYVQNDANFTIKKNNISISTKTDYPYDGEVSMKVAGGSCKIALRIPGWCSRFSLFLNEVKVESPEIQDGYVFIQRDWQDDSIRLILDMPVERIYCNPAVPENVGKVCLQRGPLVYALEEVDNGKELWNVALAKNSEFELKACGDLAEGAVSIIAKGYRQISGWDKCLYKSGYDAQWKAIEMKFIPYYAWANRGKGEMRVWVKEL